MPAERRRNIHIPEFYTAHSWAVPRSVEAQARSPSAKLVWHFASFSLIFSFFFFYVCCRDATLSHSDAKKTSIRCLEHTVSTTDCACGEPENFFFGGGGQIIFFSPSHVALEFRCDEKQRITVALRSNRKKKRAIFF